MPKTIEDPNRIEPYEVVSIQTGKRWLPPYMRRHPWGEGYAYRQAVLKKDGTPSILHGGKTVVTAESKYVYLSDYAAWDAERETLAGPIREEIKRLAEETASAEARLLALYRPAT